MINVWWEGIKNINFYCIPSYFFFAFQGTIPWFLTVNDRIAYFKECEARLYRNPTGVRNSSTYFRENPKRGSVWPSHERIACSNCRTTQNEIGFSVFPIFHFLANHNSKHKEKKQRCYPYRRIVHIFRCEADHGFIANNSSCSLNVK